MKLHEKRSSFYDILAKKLNNTHTTKNGFSR